MGTLGKPLGVFDLNDSDNCVGSYIVKSDVKEILGVNDDDLSNIPFEHVDGHTNIEIIDEKKLMKMWYEKKIPNALPKKGSSLDELILIPIIRRALPGVQIETQIRISKLKMDFKLTYQGKSVFVEFDGPSHFAVTSYGPPKYHPFRKREIVQEKTGIEVVNWGYWIQRCESNVKVLFDRNIKGYGALWSTNVHFGSFVCEKSDEIIMDITRRFNAYDDDGFGYLYGARTRGRNNPEHPVIQEIKKGKKDRGLIIPKGNKMAREFWLPDKLK
jgi:hypothetical protein